MNMGYNETGVNFGKTLLKYKKDAVTAGLSIVDPRYQNKDGGWAKTNTGYNLVDPEFAELIPCLLYTSRPRCFYLSPPSYLP